MPTVEFVYEKTCPNIAAARRQLIEAFSVAGVAPLWSEWEISDPEAPEKVRQYGSPTILVDGKDIAGIPATEARACCRIYTLQGDQRGIPPLGMIVAALDGEKTALTHQSETGAIRLNAAMLPPIGVALLPKLTCPLCWPAYAGLLSSLGIGFVDYTPYLMPLTGAFLAVAVLALAYRAPTRRGYGPFLLGSVGAGIVGIGAFGFGSDLAMWSGLGILVAASLWNTWPMRRSARAEQKSACPVCVTSNA